jgi:deoxyribodipyrimidine photo-lyase
MSVRICLFTCDLRLADNPVLHAAALAADEVVPVFVMDPAVATAGFAAPNRLAFLSDSLTDLNAQLQSRGSRLVLRHGDTAEEIGRLVHGTGAEAVHVAAGHSRFARNREGQLRAVLSGQHVRLVIHDAVATAVAPGTLTPGGGTHYAVFTPYFRRWSGVALRHPLPAPDRLTTPAEPLSAPLPGRPGPGVLAPLLVPGGEREGRKRLHAWVGAHLAGYEDEHDALAHDLTSRLSPYLHFGCLSATETVCLARSVEGPGARAFERQLAWRDFHHQVLAARPDAAHCDYRPRHQRYRHAPEDLAAWREGRTGYPIVDAAMRQLRQEGWMHNRGRLLTASFLCKTLQLDWRSGARFFLSHLVDGDVANNQLNWQWVAGTGTDTRPERTLNPVTQAKRYDADGAYVRRWVPELARLTASAIHEPWRLPLQLRQELGYPEPIVELGQSPSRFREAGKRMNGEPLP